MKYLEKLNDQRLEKQKKKERQNNNSQNQY